MISFPYNANIAGYDDDGMPIFDRAIDALTQRQLTKLFYTMESTRIITVKTISGSTLAPA